MARPSRPPASTSSPTFFQVLGVQPAMGRAFTQDDARNGAPRSSLLSDAWWRRQFNADPNIVGKAFDMNGQQTTVIGVLPRTSTSAQSLLPAPRSTPSHPSTSTARRATGATSSPSSAASSPASRSRRPRTTQPPPLPHMCWNNQDTLDSCGNYKAPCRPRPAQGLRQRQAAPLAGRPLVRRRRHSAHRLRQPLQSSARPRRRPHQGVRHAHRARRQPRAHRASVAHRKPDPLRQREPSADSALPPRLIAWLRHQGAIALPLLSTLHIDRRRARLDRPHRRLRRHLLRPAPRSAHGLRQSAGIAQGLRRRAPARAASTSACAPSSSSLKSRSPVCCWSAPAAAAQLPQRSSMSISASSPSTPPPSRSITTTAPHQDVASAEKRTVIFQQVIARVSAIPGVQAAGISDYLPLGQNRAWGLPVPKGVVKPKKLWRGPSSLRRHAGLPARHGHAHHTARLHLG
jgi:hypothetical protein